MVFYTPNIPDGIWYCALAWDLNNFWILEHTLKETTPSSLPQSQTIENYMYRSQVLACNTLLIWKPTLMKYFKIRNTTCNIWQDYCPFKKIKASLLLKYNMCFTFNMNTSEMARLTMKTRGSPTKFEQFRERERKRER